jgi:predicted transcriptional regulator
MESNIEREIISYISEHEGGVGFYHVARRFGLPEAVYDLPAVLENLIGEGFVDVVKAGSGTDERYRLTEKGHQVLMG